MKKFYHLDPKQQIEFGLYIRSLRESIPLTQAKVAEVINISTGYISSLEAGTRNPPSPKILEKMAQVYNTDLEKLKAAAGYFNENKLNQLSKDRIDWAFEAACKDPSFDFGMNNLYKILPLETKAFIVEIYEAATKRRLLTLEEKKLGQDTNGC